MSAARSFRKSPRTLGLALGAGGARGLAHVGVLRALGEAGIQIDAVVGTSSGALVGAVYAAGQLENFERQVRELDWSDVVSMFDPVWPRSGLLSGNRGIERLGRVLGDWRIEDLAIPFAAVSVDLMTGDEVLLRRGKVLDAIRASISIPGIFTPRRVGRQVLVDGAIRNPVPVSALDEMDVDVRVAVNLHHQPVREIASLPAAKRGKRGQTVAARVSDAIDRRIARFRRRAHTPRSRTEEDDGGLPNLFDILTASMSLLEYEIARHRLALDPVDVVIEPDVHSIRAFEFHKAHLAVRAGHAAATACIGEIERALRRRKLLRR